MFIVMLKQKNYVRKRYVVKQIICKITMKQDKFELLYNFSF